jgi:hypothetical protein
MAENDYYQKYISEIVGGMMPSLKSQQKGMYDFTMANVLRTGQSSQAVQEGMAGYADAAGKAAAGASSEAARMAQQQEQFDTGQANWEKTFTQGQANWEESMKVQQEQQNTANMIAMFEQTGWTQDLLDAMGYDKDSAGGAAFNRMLDDLGFNQPEGTGSGSKDGGSIFGSGNPYPGQHQFYRNKAGSQFGGATGLVYA